LALTALDHVAIGARSEAAATLVLGSVLQQIGIPAPLYRFRHAERAVDFFARRDLPDEVSFTVLCGHDLLGQPDGDVTSSYGWEARDLKTSNDTAPGLREEPREREPVNQRYVRRWVMRHAHNAVRGFDQSAQREQLIPAGAPLDFVPETRSAARG
jgi:hypothetical protein